MEQWGMSTSALQCDPEHCTGRVNVHFTDNEPEYTIAEPCAYDFIAPTPKVQNTLRDCALLYHGTLALRDPVSAASFSTLQKQHNGRVFLDVNLRTPWWQKEQVLLLIKQADWVKLNADEAALLFGLEQEQNREQGLISLISKHNLQGIILTRGAQGAMVVTATKKVYTAHPDKNTPLLDTVGAGDAFASIMILGLHKNWPIATSLERAQQFASAVVGQRGATVTNRNFYDNFSCQWQTDIITD
jgi:fructokinase